MSKNIFVPMNYVSRNNIINYDEEESEELAQEDNNKMDKDIIADNYIYNYLD